MSTSVSSVLSHFPTAQNGFTTTTAGSVSSGATTVTLNSVAGYTNGEPVVLVIEPTSSSAKQTFTGIIDTSGVQVTSVVWTAGTNQTHALGVTVVDYATATHIAMMSKGIKVNHTQKGNHKTLTDDNANEWIGLTTTASAVNYADVANSATGNAPIISAKGDDATVHLNLRGKGLAKTVTIGAGATTVYPYDYVASGCVITADAAGSTLNFSMSSGVVVINGNPVTVASFSASAATASRDTYVDVLDNGDGTGLVVKTGGNIVTNNAVSPALAANSVRVGIVVSGAGNIASAASINQGEETKVLPIVSSIPYTVTDGLGNLICPRDPHRKLLGMRRITANLAGLAATTATALTGLSVTFLPISGRKYVVSVGGSDWQSAAALFLDQWIYDTNTSGTVLSHNAFNAAGANGFAPLVNESYPITAASGSAVTVIAAYAVSTSSITLRATTSPAWIKVILV